MFVCVEDRVACGRVGGTECNSAVVHAWDLLKEVTIIFITSPKSKNGGVEGHVIIFSLENSKITTCYWTTINRKMLDSTKKTNKQKKTPRPKAKEKPQQDGRRGKIAFRITAHTHQKCMEGSNKTLCTPGDSTETEPDLPLSVWVSPV